MTENLSPKLEELTERDWENIAKNWAEFFTYLICGGGIGVVIGLACSDIIPRLIRTERELSPEMSIATGLAGMLYGLAAYFDTSNIRPTRKKVSSDSDQ